MHWLYRLQTRAGLSGPEGAAALVLVAALAVGVVVHHRQGASSPVPPDFYAAADEAFAVASRAEGDTAAAVPLALVAAPTSPDDPATDSSGAQIAEAEVEAAAAPRRTGKPPPAPTNINTASAADLQRLPRIGPALAERIVAYRQANGPFRSPEQITGVKGIGDKTFEKLRPWIRL